MPAFTLLTDLIYEVTIFQRYQDGQTVENIFSYQAPSSYPQAAPTSTQLLTAVALRWGEVADTCQTNGYFTQVYRVVEIVPADASRQRFDTLPVSLEGGLAQEALPPSVAIVVRRQTNIVGRRNRGRWFLCGAPKGFSAGGQLANNIPVAATTALGAMTNQALLTPGQVLIASPVLTRPVRANIEPFPILSYDPRLVTGVLIDTVLRSQRRRENGVGI